MNIHCNFACFAPLLLEGVFRLELDPRIKLRSSFEGVELEMKSAIVIRYEAKSFFLVKKGYTATLRGMC